MSVFICGDVHQTYDIYKLRQFKEDCEKGIYNLTKNDYVIICGDFGLLWDNPTTLKLKGEKGQSIEINPSDKNWSSKELKLLEWYNQCPWTTLWIDGNHENMDRLYSYPVSEWHGGLVQKISDSVIHLMRGEIYKIDNHTFFCMGGAESTDRGRATGTQEQDIGVCWWPQEIPSTGEWNHAIQKLDTYNNKVDFVLTHDAPVEVKRMLGIHDVNSFSIRLGQLYQTIDFTHWFCGHVHRDERLGRITTLYRSSPVNVEYYIGE